MLRWDKPAGFTFKESDFYPEGTTEGEAAGVPPGKVAITFDLTQVTGARDLKAGDHVDLGGTQTVDLSKTNLGKMNCERHLARGGEGRPVPPAGPATRSSSPG